MKLQITTEQPIIGLTDEQVKEGRGYITATGAAKIMNGEWQELWEDKMGFAEPFEPNLPMLIGTHLEQLHHYWWNKQADQFDLYRVAKDPSDPLVICPSNNLFACHTDGFLIDEEVTGQIVRPWEGKCVNGFSKMDDLLVRYKPQLQHIMLCTEAESIEFSVIFLNNRHESVTVYRDNEWISTYVERATQFWQYVIDQQRPPEIEVEEIPHEDKGIVRADPVEHKGFVQAAEIWIKNEKSAKAFEKAKKDIKAFIPPTAKTIFTEDVVAAVASNGALRISKMTKAKLKFLEGELDG